MTLVLHGTATTLRPLEPRDLETLVSILEDPDVARWWGRYDRARVRREFLEASDTIVFVIEVDGEVVGSVQYAEEPAPDYRHASLDVFLHSAWHGKGLGADAVRTLSRHLFHDRGHHRLTIDPSVDNEKAIRTYRRVGFREVGVMRQYERTPDGRWQDCLLMELLEGDLD